MILRRKRSRPDLIEPHRAFLDVVALTEDAKVAITHAMPTTRYQGTPMAEALSRYEMSLNRAAELMPRWRASEVEHDWQRCADAIDGALEMARKLRMEAPELGGFEGLAGTAGDLIGALDPFADAEARFRQLRRS